jgi:hypothetical protein
VLPRLATKLNSTLSRWSLGSPKLGQRVLHIVLRCTCGDEGKAAGNSFAGGFAVSENPNNALEIFSVAPIAPAAWRYSPQSAALHLVLRYFYLIVPPNCSMKD